MWTGFQRQIDQTELASYVNIVSDEEIEIEVISKLECERVQIKPFSKGISHSEEDGKPIIRISAESFCNMKYRDIEISNIFVNGKRISKTDIQTDIDGAEDISF